MIAASETRKKIWSGEELQSLPDDGFIHEVVDGDTLPPGFRYPIARLLKSGIGSNPTG